MPQPSWLECKCDWPNAFEPDQPPAQWVYRQHSTRIRRRVWSKVLWKTCCESWSKERLRNEKRYLSNLLLLPPREPSQRRSIFYLRLRQYKRSSHLASRIPMPKNGSTTITWDDGGMEYEDQNCTGREAEERSWHLEWSCCRCVRQSRLKETSQWSYSRIGEKRTDGHDDVGDFLTQQISLWAQITWTGKLRIALCLPYLVTAVIGQIPHRKSTELRESQRADHVSFSLYGHAMLWLARFDITPRGNRWLVPIILK